MGARPGARLQLGHRFAGGVMATPEVTREALWSFDLAEQTVRDLNAQLHAGSIADATSARLVVLNPGGRHAIAVGLDAPYDVDIEGHVGYYCAGMNKLATVRVRGNCGVGVAENMMSGVVIVEGSASQSAGATARGGLLVIHGDASARCGISLKGADIVVRGSIGHMGAFMGQKGCLVVCGDAGESLGDSIYEARLYVRGSVAGLGADCIEKEMRLEHVAQVRELLDRAGVNDVNPADFRRYGSARRLYNFHVDNLGSY
jgi:methylamine---glutamate N-methyltransferase subunit B